MIPTAAGAVLRRSFVCKTALVHSMTPDCIAAGVMLYCLENGFRLPRSGKLCEATGMIFVDSCYPSIDFSDRPCYNESGKRDLANADDHAEYLDKLIGTTKQQCKDGSSPA